MQAARGLGRVPLHSNPPLLVPSPPTVTPTVKSSFSYYEALRAEPLGAKTSWTVSKGPELACLDLTLSPDPSLHGSVCMPTGATHANLRRPF